MHLLIRLVFPVIWKIDPRLWTGWTEMGQIAILGGVLWVMPKAKPFTRLKITPLSRNLMEFSFSILKVCQKACINLKDSEAYRDHVRKCIICETAKLLYKTGCCCLALQSINVKVFQDIKGEGSLWPMMAGWK